MNTEDKIDITKPFDIPMPELTFRQSVLGPITLLQVTDGQLFIATATAVYTLTEDVKTDSVGYVNMIDYLRFLSWDRKRRAYDKAKERADYEAKHGTPMPEQRRGSLEEFFANPR